MRILLFSAAEVFLDIAVLCLLRRLKSLRLATSMQQKACWIPNGATTGAETPRASQTTPRSGEGSIHATVKADAQGGVALATGKQVVVVRTISDSCILLKVTMKTSYSHRIEF